MSHYKPYPVYKDSGVEWLGQVPGHWAVSPLKYVVTFRSGGTPSKDKQEFWDGDIPWASAKDLKKEQLEDTQDHLTELAVTSGAASLVPAGSVLVVVRGMILARIFPVAEAMVPMAINQDLKALHASSKLDGRFLAHLLRGLADESLCRLEEAGHGTKALRMEAWTSMQLTIPPSEEQCAILSHLDRETVRIDALVEKKARFIELLREKRQALITHAVTKGLDPNVKMKDSGVEWLGEVPEHWAVCKLSFRYSVELGKMLDEKKLTKTSLVPYLRNQDVQWGAINIQNLPEMDIHPAEIERYTVMDGDLMVCEGGDVGRAAIWRGESSVFGYQKALHRLRPRLQNTDTAEFFFFSLLTAKKRGVFEESDSKATIAHLPAEKFRQYRFAFPPKREQREIADHVRIESDSLDVLLTKTARSIALLKERRSALITAAVTGQIDLREAT
ncbi:MULTISPECIES: restriction endonuclease subunit S [Pseudomonas]|uniref:Restriction endonuclease subunit S n=1 Tax=Pseudomonas fontis TaxID=2942633 RepID=A0ABT5NNF1_9PSED|nr:MULTISPECIES: restriction endonuclease subunit S [Pseudomonas]MDD0973185.1 restriction endonuclease subunit S [Pseudomonas fontis]MDD0989683.1 restriction endonuclease subunit S [Pseudomonas fontis]